jgi:uncharacterized protein (DUF433 family)
VTGPTPRPTREQVDAALRRAEHGGGKTPPLTTDVLAAEVRALRAERGDLLVEGERLCAQIDVAIAEKEDRARMLDLAREDLRDLRAALAARTPQPADEDGPPECYPAAVTVFCDRCSVEHTGDYLVSDTCDSRTRLGYARAHMRTLDWRCDTSGDFCPACRPLSGAAPQPTEPCGCCLGDPNTVCAACGEHSCWAGKFLCEDALFAGTTTRAPQPAEAESDDDDDDGHGPWFYTEYGVLCSCRYPVDKDERCTRPRDLRGQEAALTGALFEAADSLVERIAAGHQVDVEDSYVQDLRAARDELSGWGAEHAEELAREAVPQPAVPDGDDADELLLVRMPGRKSGRVTIGHSRLPVETIWELIAAGDDDDRLVAAFPAVDAAALRVLRRLRDDLTEPEPDGDFVPARLDAAADALATHALADTGAYSGLRYAARQLRNASPEVRATVAAALARPTGDQP